MIAGRFVMAAATGSLFHVYTVRVSGSGQHVAHAHVLFAGALGAGGLRRGRDFVLASGPRVVARRRTMPETATAAGPPCSP